MRVERDINNTIALSIFPSPSSARFKISSIITVLRAFSIDPLALSLPPFLVYVMSLLIKVINEKLTQRNE
jgi:hypothetical protein